MFQTRLKEAREAAGYKSQQSFANAFGIAQSTVGGWESGTREPNIEKLVKIAQLLNVSIDYLLENGKKDFTKRGDIDMNDFKFLTTEYHSSLMEDFQNASNDDKLSILKANGVPPSLISYFNAHVNSNHPKKELSEEAYQIGAAYEQADSGTKGSIRKLLDVPEKTKTPTRRTV